LPLNFVQHRISLVTPPFPAYRFVTFQHVLNLVLKCDRFTSDDARVWMRNYVPEILKCL
jgi:hypothetical protein